MSEHDSIPRKMAGGAAWMVLMGFLSRAIGLISSLCLARLLVPEDFGLIAMAMTLVGLVEIMGAFNFDYALIQNQNAQRHHYDTAWTLNLLYGHLVALILVALAIPTAAFYGDPRVEGLLYVFAVCAQVRSFKNIGTVAFRKELVFRKEFKLGMAGRVAGAIVTVTLAYFWRTYWALAIGSLVSAFIGLAISYRMHPFRPRLCLAGWRELMSFSGWVLFSNIIIFTGNRAYDFVIGRIGGAVSLGTYSIAYELANLPTTEIVWPATRAIFPGFSKIAADREKLKEMFLDTSALVALLTIPAGAGVAVLADPMVRVLLGVKWIEAVPLVQILAMFGILRAMQAGSGSVFLALGMTRMTVWVAMPHIVVGLPLAAFLLTTHGLAAATSALVVAGGIAFAMSFGILKHVLSIGLAQLLAAFWRPLIAATAMVILEWSLLRRIEGSEGLVLAGWMLLLIVVGVATYGLCVLLLWYLTGRPSGAEQVLIRALREYRRRS